MIENTITLLRAIADNAAPLDVKVTCDDSLDAGEFQIKRINFRHVSMSTATWEALKAELERDQVTAHIDERLGRDVGQERG